MRKASVSDQNYIDFLIATPKVCSALEAAKVQPCFPESPSHDCFTRLLNSLEPDPEILWLEAKASVRLGDGVLVLDDSVLDKPYSRHIQLVGRHWSGKHHRVVSGIDLVSLVWTDGDRTVPCDYRIFHTSEKLTKNDHFRNMLLEAKERGFQPQCVCFDSWYGSCENLKFLRDQMGWIWLTRLKANRLVNKDRQALKPVSQTEIASSGTVVWLKGYGLVKVFKIVSTGGDVEYWATSDLEMSELTRLTYAEWSWGIEDYHKAIKQCTQIEKCQARSGRAQRNHIGMALRAFLRLAVHAYHTGTTWFEAKNDICRVAVRMYLASPSIGLDPC
jgi:hypothetical protein